MSSGNCEKLIIGGGVMGLLSAWMLAKEGVQVALLDRQLVGHESSWAGGGILSPLNPWNYPDAVNRLAQRSQALYPSIVQAVESESGLKADYIKSGMLVLNPEIGAAALKRWSEQFDQPSFNIKNNEIKEVEPLLVATDGQAVWMPEVAQIRNPRWVAALRAAVEKSGVKIIENQEVNKILVHDGRVQGARTAVKDYVSEQILVTTGAWTAKLLAGLGKNIDIQPVKGQMIILKTPPGTLRRIVLCGNHYLIPRADGRVLVGSTLEQAGFDKTTRDETREELRNFAVDLVPELSRYPVEHHWAGLRPGTPEGVPIISGVPGAEGLFINAGHFRNGLVLSIASCELGVDLMLDRKPLLDCVPYQLT